MRFAVEPAPNGSWRVVLEGADAPVSVHDTEDEARERLAAYVRGAMEDERRRASSSSEGGEDPGRAV